MWSSRVCVFLDVVILSLFSPYTAMEGDAGGIGCSSLDDGALATLTGKRLPALVCLEDESTRCCPNITEAPPNCSTWDLCPQATLTDADSIQFIDKVPEGVPVLQYLSDKCPCASPNSSSSNLFLVLHPLYSWPGSTSCADLGENCLFELPDVYAGAQVQIAMNHPHTPDTNCCCCLRLDYYLTWSQMRVFGQNSQKRGDYIADWINAYGYNGSFLEKIGHGKWRPNMYCPSLVLHNTSTIAGGHAIFSNAAFDLSHALDKAIDAGFTRQTSLMIGFSVTVVVALSQYCYKIKNATTDCQYSGKELRTCVYGSPQVVSTLAAGEASYRQTFLIPPEGSPSPGTGLANYRRIDQKEDIECLEEFAGNARKLFQPDDNFNLNSIAGAPTYKESSSWQYLPANSFTSDKCNHMHVRLD